MKGKKPKWLQRRMNRRRARYSDQFNSANGEPHTDAYLYRKSKRRVKAERRRKKEEKWAAILGKDVKE